ncbi:MAG: hypothetical protein KJN89_04500 [Gammaproteobacteria bacterium]|nr:hypothetical protein [Gammaproteobacteria bacterium]NNJ49613.1 hypothetical protein [Gammaproteobacteria bacterium]
MTASKYSIVLVALLLAVTGCTTESWYHGAKSAQTSHCMKEPISEYEDCIKQAGEDDESYHGYKEKREQLLQ